MKKQLTIICLGLLATMGYAQDKSFDLSKYKFPDYKRHELEFNFNSNGGNDSRTNSTTHFDENGNVLTSDKLTYSGFQGNSTIGYGYNFLSRKRIDYLYSNFSGGFNHRKDSNYGDITKLNSPSLNYNLSGYRRYYQREDKLFFEGMTNLSYHYDKSKSTYSNPARDDYSYGQKYFSFSGGLGIGYGRKEKVSDLWQAYYILAKLKGQNSLERELTNNDIFEFATLASKLKNKRFFDYRLKAIAELQVLDSLLHKQGLIENTDIAYFTTLNDYWSYGSFPNRESGNVIKLWITPDYAKVSFNSNSESLTSDKSSLISNLSFSHSKQLNLFWERNFDVLIWDEVLLNRSGNYFDAYRNNTFSYKASYGYSFFPNSRTSISGNLAVTGIDIYMPDNAYSGIIKWHNSIQANLSAVYYISPQLQITGHAGFEYYKDYFVYDERTAFSYNLGLRYAIF